MLVEKGDGYAIFIADYPQFNDNIYQRTKDVRLASLAEGDKYIELYTDNEIVTYKGISDRKEKTHWVDGILNRI